MKKRAVSIALSLLSSVTEDNVWLSDFHKKAISPFLIEDFSAYTHEQYVVHIAKLVLEDFKKEGVG